MTFICSCYILHTYILKTSCSIHYTQLKFLCTLESVTSRKDMAKYLTLNVRKFRIIKFLNTRLKIHRRRSTKSFIHAVIIITIISSYFFFVFEGGEMHLRTRFPWCRTHISGPPPLKRIIDYYITNWTAEIAGSQTEWHAEATLRAPLPDFPVQLFVENFAPYFRPVLISIQSFIPLVNSNDKKTHIVFFFFTYIENNILTYIPFFILTGRLWNQKFKTDIVLTKARGNHNSLKHFPRLGNKNLFLFGVSYSSFLTILSLVMNVWELDIWVNIKEYTAVVISW